MYIEEQHQQRMKDEEAERLAREAEQHRRRETPETWEHYFAKQEEANRRARAADLGGMTSETRLIYSDLTGGQRYHFCYYLCILQPRVGSTCLIQLSFIFGP
jgi:hypothetical protein